MARYAEIYWDTVRYIELWWDISRYIEIGVGVTVGAGNLGGLFQPVVV